MASEPSRADAWRQTGAGAGAPRRARSAGGRRYPWFVAAALTAALAGLIAGVYHVTSRPALPVLLTIPVTQYDAPDWPPNPYAESDAAALRAALAGATASAFQDQQRLRLLGALAAVADASRGAERGRPLVVSLSALSLAEGDQVYLVPGDGRPADPATWVKLDDILDAFRRSDVPRLLILDLRPADGAHATLAPGDANEALHQALTRLDAADELPFLVLTADTPPGGPCLLRPWPHSAFGLALAHGAGGAADGWTGEPRDGRVSDRELVAYVCEVTAAASGAYGPAPQRPRAYGRSKEFVVNTYPVGGPATLPDLPPTPAVPEWLARGWLERDAWVKDGVHRRAPRVERHLARASAAALEQWRAGAPEAAVQARHEPLVKGLAAEKAKCPPARVSVVSVALAQRDPVPEAQEASARRLLEPIFAKLRDAAAKPEELPALLKGLAAKPPEECPPDVAAAKLLEFALSLENPTQNTMKQLAETARAFRPPLRHAELASVELVAGVRANLVERRWPEGTVRGLLQLAQLVEQSAAVEGRCLPAVKSRLEEIDAKRRDTLRTLFDPNQDDGPLREATAGLGELARQYRLAIDLARALEDALAEWQEARAVLADLAVSFSENSGDLARTTASSWPGLIDAIRLQLEMNVAPGSGYPTDATAVTPRTEALRARRAAIFGLLQPTAFEDIRRGQALLAWPRWTHAERLAMLARLTRLEREAAERVAADWPTTSARVEVPKRSPATARGQGIAAARLGDLLSLAGGKRPAADAGDVWRAWRQELPREYKAADDLDRARSGWLVDPWDVSAVPLAGTPDGAPHAEANLARAEARDWRAWLARRYREDARAMTPPPTGVPNSSADALRDYGAARAATARLLEAAPP